MKKRRQFYYKISTIVVILSVSTYFLYFVAYHFIPRLPLYSSSMSSRAKIITSPPCIVAIGGSNVLYGISAKLLQYNLGCTAYNLGISPGGEGTSRLYFRWLSQMKFHPKIIVYSPAELLSNKEIDEIYYPISIIPTDIFPRVSLGAALRAFFIDSRDNTVDSFGDFNKYPDRILQPESELDYRDDDFAKASEVVAKNISKKIEVLCSTFPTSNIFLVVPQKYVGSFSRERFNFAVHNRLRFLEIDECKVTVLKNLLNHTPLSSELFVDINHLNAIGRQKFTENLIHEIFEAMKQ